MAATQDAGPGVDRVQQEGVENSVAGQDVVHRGGEVATHTVVPVPGQSVPRLDHAYLMRDLAMHLGGDATALKVVEVLSQEYSQHINRKGIR